MTTTAIVIERAEGCSCNPMFLIDRQWHFGVYDRSIDEWTDCPHGSTVRVVEPPGSEEAACLAVLEIPETNIAEGILLRGVRVHFVDDPDHWIVADNESEPGEPPYWVAYLYKRAKPFVFEEPHAYVIGEACGETPEEAVRRAAALPALSGEGEGQ